MRNLLKILFGSIIALLLNVSCSHQHDRNEPICTKEQPVIIIATIDNASTRTDVVTRAMDGNVKGDPTIKDEWKPEEVGAQEYERTIAHVFLFVYKKGETVPYKVFFYHNVETSPLSDIPNLDIRRLNIANYSPSSFAMDLELLPGAYNFVMIANSEAALKKMQEDNKIPKPEELKEENSILTSDDLQGRNRKYLPMVGQHELYVPNYRTGSDMDRLELVPDIKLERVHARVEFILTTANNGETEYLSPILPLSQVKSLTLENEQKIYTVMPSADDYTVTGEDQLKPVRATALNSKETMTDRESFHQGTENTEGKIDRLKERLLPYNKNNSEIKKYIYVAPSTLATKPDECLTVLFKVRFANDSEDTVYRIPLTNVGVSGNQLYATRRNTIYRLNAKLIGRDLSVLNYNVIDWTNQDVDVPW